MIGLLFRNKREFTPEELDPQIPFPNVVEELRSPLLDARRPKLLAYRAKRLPELLAERQRLRKEMEEAQRKFNAGLVTGNAITHIEERLTGVDRQISHLQNQAVGELIDSCPRNHPARKRYDELRRRKQRRHEQGNPLESGIRDLEILVRRHERNLEGMAPLGDAHPEVMHEKKELLTVQEELAQYRREFEALKADVAAEQKEVEALREQMASATS
jgi:hypothetical protein